MVNFFIILICGVLAILGVAKAMQMMRNADAVNSKTVETTTLVKDDPVWRKKAMAFRAEDERKKTKEMILISLVVYLALLAVCGAGMVLGIKYLNAGAGVTIFDTIIGYGVIIIIGSVIVAGFGIKILWRLGDIKDVLF